MQTSLSKIGEALDRMPMGDEDMALLERAFQLVRDEVTIQDLELARLKWLEPIHWAFARAKAENPGVPLRLVVRFERDDDGKPTT